MKGKNIENKIEKLEREVANMRDSIARTEVEFSGCTAFEFNDLTNTRSMMMSRTGINMLKNYGQRLFNVKGL